ncbi:MAG: GAF domain-containing protein [Gammaproteobacteria bacterium]
MFEIDAPDYGTDKAGFYASVAAQASSLVAGERDRVANAANIAALIFQCLPDVNWAGFYFRDGEGLVVGPFQGKPACVRIPLGRGVCGTAAAEGRTVLVEDVDAFPGHIACDAASRSEVVVPVRDASGDVIAVLDIDSPSPGRFDAGDAAGLESLAEVYARSLSA